MGGEIKKKIMEDGVRIKALPHNGQVERPYMTLVGGGREYIFPLWVASGARALGHGPQASWLCRRRRRATGSYTRDKRERGECRGGRCDGEKNDSYLQKNVKYSCFFALLKHLMWLFSCICKFLYCPSKMSVFFKFQCTPQAMKLFLFLCVCLHGS